MDLRFSDRTDTHGGMEALPSYSHSRDVQQYLGGFGVILTRGGWVGFFFFLILMGRHQGCCYRRVMRSLHMEAYLVLKVIEPKM